jgi:PEP-CTERM motif
MHKTLVCLLTAAILALSPAAHALILVLTPSSTAVDPGEDFTVQVTASQVFDGLDPADEVLTFGFDVTVSDPTRTAFTGATVGGGFDDDSPSLPDTDVAGEAFPSVTDDAIVLALLSFRAGQPGAVELGIASDLSDPNEGLRYLLAGQRELAGGVTITVVPEPSTALLLAAGVALLVGLGMRRSAF